MCRAELWMDMGSIWESCHYKSLCEEFITRSFWLCTSSEYVILVVEPCWTEGLHRFASAWKGLGCFSARPYAGGVLDPESLWL